LGFLGKFWVDDDEAERQARMRWPWFVCKFLLSHFLSICSVGEKLRGKRTEELGFPLALWKELKEKVGMEKKNGKKLNREYNL
jgi:hypothetical protein